MSVVPEWTLAFSGYDPADECRREALCTTGNGYVATRGAWAGAVAGDHHYPGTYLAGYYNRLTDTVDDLDVENESLVNLPDWLPLTFAVDDGEWWTPDSCEVLEYALEVDARRGVVTRRFHLRDTAGRELRAVERRFVSMADPHLAGQTLTITVVNWSGRLRIGSAVRGNVTNSGVERYRKLSTHHLTDLRSSIADGDLLVTATMSQSRHRVSVGTRSVASHNGSPLEHWTTSIDTTSAYAELTVDVTAGDVVGVEKVAAIHGSRDVGISEPQLATQLALDNAPCFCDLLEAHVLAWSQLWRRFEVDLEETYDGTLPALRLNIFHLLQSVSPHSVDADTGVPARGLHGEAYRGHVFWDELFVFPVLTLRIPELTRALLRYRHRRLPAARLAAWQIGLPGAMYPWQSGSDGREESQRLHLNPLSGHWTEDASFRQRHVGLAVAYTMWQYVETTGDLDFLSDHGAEVIVEVARFFAHLSEYDATRDRYVIKGVVGPDEFHTSYPGRPNPGIDNNAYTNMMAVWLFGIAARALDRLPAWRRIELVESLGLRQEELNHWDELTRRLYVPFHDGVISQFEGYEQLAELDWPRYRATYGDIRRLDRILEAEGHDVSAYQVSKQADVLMLLYLLPRRDLYGLMERLGYPLSADVVRKTVEYYLARTCHGSSLSAIVHAWGLATLDADRALAFLEQALHSDAGDAQHTGTTAEGIHLAAMAGSADLIQRCFTGLTMTNDVLRFRPRWPAKLGTLRMVLRYRGHRLVAEVSSTAVTVTVDPGPGPAIKVRCYGDSRSLRPGDTHTWVARD
ncbi:glycoside hydrolase family 65 protein [Kribbella shirazensis]|uniref:Trehalose/maltose hydrolase-like predicted phosphorylase n=1 Tax=Kribbella shirazensis TaxID=1105143 RepID=A0A7X5VDD9_9ACTN|nr:glycoside hydrolase family 65 protein [Kribbella shirazensis]NIK59154.1 trehalose/maltose hydrolase-like predicted phosphorylase [Kribbella shirazensis]